MYARSIKCRNKDWKFVVPSRKYFSSFNRQEYSAQRCVRPVALGFGSSTGKFIFNPSFFIGLSPVRRCMNVDSLSYFSMRSCLLRYYSSEGDGKNASEDKCVTSRVDDCDKEKCDKGDAAQSSKHSDAHALLGKQDQIDWMKSEALALDYMKKESPFLTRRDRFRNDFLRKIVPWDKITVSWDTFPYYIDEHNKNLLVECTSSHLKQKQLSSDYGRHLTSSNGRILLQSAPGMELYRERLVRALARDLQVPLMMLDGYSLAPYDHVDDELESDDNSGSSESDVEDGTVSTSDEEYTSSSETKGGESDDGIIDIDSKEFRKLIPCTIEEFERSVSGEPDNSQTLSQSEDSESSNKSNQPLKKGDPVKYIGPSFKIEAISRMVTSGQRGEVHEINSDQVAVIFDVGDKMAEEVKDEKSAELAEKSTICWLPLKDLEHDFEAEAQDYYVAMEVLCQVLESRQPIIVYFNDSSLWLSKTTSKSVRKEIVQKVQEMFDKLSGPIVLICGQNKVEAGQKESERFTMVLPSLSRLAKLPLTIKRLTEELKGSKKYEQDEIHKLFTNVMFINPPKEEDPLRTFNKQIEEDRRIVVSRCNLIEMHKVLEEHSLSCLDLLDINTDGVILTREKAEKIVGWAKNHYLSSCPLPSVKGDRLHLPRESLEIAIFRLKELETASKKTSQNFQTLAQDEYESNFVSAVVPPGEIGVRFDDVGALEDVKKALNELVILPMRRPELFAHGNLLQPCKGILLFGPPGTGKTLLGKALATEAGANFISITGSTLTSKWFGDAEKLTKALFSIASKLAPVIIFVDEVDSLLGARGGASEHEATRRMRNEFMAAWDGLRSKSSQRILIVGATNRPFDLDDAVIRRLPRRIYVGLPDADNRAKILKIILAQENLEPGFQLEKLANATEGYSGSDLKNLCVAAAYRPVQEILEEESKGGKVDKHHVLRPLNLDDFMQSKAKVGPSVAYDAASMNEVRKWNEQYGEGGSRRKSPFGF